MLSSESQNSQAGVPQHQNTGEEMERHSPLHSEQLPRLENESPECPEPQFTASPANWAQSSGRAQEFPFPGTPSPVWGEEGNKPGEKKGLTPFSPPAKVEEHHHHHHLHIIIIINAAN